MLYTYKYIYTFDGIFKNADKMCAWSKECFLFDKSFNLLLKWYDWVDVVVVIVVVGDFVC